MTIPFPHSPHVEQADFDTENSDFETNMAQFKRFFSLPTPKPTSMSWVHLTNTVNVSDPQNVYSTPNSVVFALFFVTPFYPRGAGTVIHASLFIFKLIIYKYTLISCHYSLEINYYDALSSIPKCSLVFNLYFTCICFQFTFWWSFKSIEIFETALMYQLFWFICTVSYIIFKLNLCKCVH